MARNQEANNWVIREFLPNTHSSTPLTNEQTADGVNRLGNVINEVPKLNRRYIDPPIQGQTFGLVSFIPAKGVVANEKGFYGYVKFRGNYDNVPDCLNRIDYIIKNVDSTNHIHICKVGMPVPLVTDGYAEEVEQIKIKDTVEKDISANVRAKAAEDKKEMEEIEAREDKLKRDVLEPNPEEEYNAKRTKLAVLRWTLKEHLKKADEIKELRDKCVRDVLKESTNNPNWEQNHLERYMEARRKANIPEDQDLPDFMAFIRSPIIDESENVDLTIQD